MSEMSVEKKRNVSFPQEDCDLVSATYGPEDPWLKDEDINAELMLSKYQESCKKHQVEPFPKLLQQLQDFDYEAAVEARLSCLDLSGCVLEFLQCETLEEVLKRLRFDTINLENTQISEEGVVALFEMIEYYEACQTLNISRNSNIQARGWQACSRMIKKTQSLRALIAKETCLKEEFIPFLARTLKIGTHLSVLNLERCNLNGRPITMLANALRMNRSLQEVYLGENNLESMDACNLSNLLTHNTNLQLLDLSNNIIGDKGAQHLCLCLAEKLQTQQQRSPQSPTETHSGLAVLVLWNNCLTHLSGQYFAKMLEKYSELEILNVGHNNLTDAWLRGLREPLRHNHSLSTLGLQSTRLTAAAAREMASVFQHNTSLERVDLRDNQLDVDGLQELSTSIENNCHLAQLDLDQNPTYLGNDIDLSRYQSIYHEISAKLIKNCERSPPRTTPSKVAQNLGITSRKISLTCEIKIPQGVPKKSLTSGRLRSPAPSPTPSPILSPIPASPGKSRFLVSKVQDVVPSTSATVIVPEVKSRFSITPVRDIPKIILPEENKVTVGFQIQQENGIFKFDSESVADQNLVLVKSPEIIIIDDNNSTECDTEVEGITSQMMENNNKNVDNLETITEINPAFIETNESPSRPGILSKKSKFTSSGTYPPRLDSYEPLRETKQLSDNSQISKAEHKSTLQNLFALFQNPPLSFSSTASAFYAKTEAKMSQIVPSLSSITLNYEPFKFHSKQQPQSKSHLEKHIDSIELTKDKQESKVLELPSEKNLSESSNNDENSKLVSADASKLELRLGKKRKSKKKNVVENSKNETFWDFGDETHSVPSTSN